MTAKIEAASTDASTMIRERMERERVLHVLLSVTGDGVFVIRSDANPEQLETMAAVLKQIAERARNRGDGSAD
jgi:hypothetical protein